MADRRNLSDILYEKMNEELATRKSEIAKKNVEDIINGFIPYEIVYKDDLLVCFEYDHMSLGEADYNFLLSLEKPLDWLYTRWLDSECSYMKFLENFIKNALEQKENKQ